MRTRLILSFTLVVLISLASFVLLMRQGAAREVRAFMIRGSMTGLDELVESLQDYFAANGSWSGVGTAEGPFRGWGAAGMGPGGMMGQGMGGMSSQRLRLADDRGRVVFDTARGQLDETLTRTELSNASALKVDGQVVGYLLAEGGLNFGLAEETNLLNRLTRAAVYAGLIGAGLSLIMAFLLSSQLLRPVQELTTAAQGLAQGNLDRRVKVSDGTELSTLGRAFNQMAESLERAEQARRDMTADIAHELRTPLAVQRANLEAIQDGIYEPSSENIQSILEQNRLLTRLVEDLRTIALADAGQLTLEPVPVDLSELLARLVERFQSNAAAQGVNLNLHVPPQPPPVIPVDPVRIEQIIGNLLSNALRYSPSGQEITLALSENAHGVQISVHDRGPGISEQAMPYIFERFYRADASRSREAGGSGLGLAIARQLAEAHAGTLSVRNDPQGGAVFTLVLPRKK